MVTIGTLNGGNITITTGGSAPASHSDTRFTLQGGTVETHNITGTLDYQWMVANEYYNEIDDAWPKTITQIDIGNTVTSIGQNAFSGCRDLTSVMIPDSVTRIGDSAFYNCNSLTIVTIGSEIQGIGGSAFSTQGDPVTLTIGKSVTEVQAMGQSDWNWNTNVSYSDWGLPSGSTIVCTNGTIPIEEV